MQWLTQLDRERLAQECSLERLSRGDVAAMLRAILDLKQEVDADLLDTLYARSEGNPFFVEELLKSLMTTGELVAVDGTWKRTERRASVPRSVQEAVQQRTVYLSADARRLLTLAAVAGRRFNVTLLQEVMHCDEAHLLALLKEVMAAQLVVEEAADQFAFRHALTQQAISAELLVRERQGLHRSLAQTLERLSTSSPTWREKYLEDLASHCYEAGMWEQALAYAQEVGEKALTLYAQQAAIDHLTRAVEAAHHLSQTPPTHLYQARGQAYETLGDFERARGDYERALDAARTVRDGRMEWQSMLSLGFLWTGRDYERAGVWFRQALALAEELADPTLYAQSLNRLGNFFERQVARVWGELALAQGEPAVALHITKQLIVSAPGDAHQQPIPHLLALKGEALLALKRLEEAAETLEGAKLGAEQRQAPSILWRIHRSLGQVYHLLKREDQAQHEWSATREIIARLAVTIDETALREHFLRTALASLPQGKPLSPEAVTSSRYGGLSAREREVAALVAQGRSNREIAASLVVSERTAEAHVSNILGKLGLTTRAQIAAWAVEKGLIASLKFVMIHAARIPASDLCGRKRRPPFKNCAKCQI